jgi:hypothetical protein
LRESLGTKFDYNNYQSSSVSKNAGERKMNQGTLIINDEKGILLAFKKKLQIPNIGMDTATELYCWRKHQSYFRYSKRYPQGQQCPPHINHFLTLFPPSQG